MRTIKNLTQEEKKVYICLRDKATQYRFMSDADREGITYGDGVKVTDRPVDEVMALQSNGTICLLGWAGRVCYHYAKQNNIVRVDYEKYVNADDGRCQEKEI